jgi:mono/diheme cytochrome c family protein
MNRIALALFFAAVAPLAAAEPKPTFSKAKIDDYTKKVVPVLKQNCMKCHGDKPEKLSGSLDLRTRAALLRGGDTGPAAVPGKPKESLLVLAINHGKEGYEMPPTGKMKDEEIAVLTKWVEDGLAFPPDLMGSDAPVTPTKPKITDEQRKYWAYQPVVRTEVPKLAPHPVDAFLQANLNEKKLTPNGPAGKRTLIRRAYYDLTGLPPTPAEIDAFEKDTDPQAWAKLIDRLLASPHYGEKWGKHWLDVVRYAETNGYERDGAKPNAWRYRDYVIRSFNSDKPYTRFLKEQFAGDEMPRTDGGDEIIATGFYRLGVWDDEPADRIQAAADGFDDIVSIAGQAVLGMTLNCARCHDHKGDPILQADYYKILAFFKDIPGYSENRNAKSANSQTDITPASKRVVYEAELAARQKEIDALLATMKPMEDAAIKKMPPEDQLAVDDGKRDQIVKKVPKFLNEADRKQYIRWQDKVRELQGRPVPAQEFALSVNNCLTNPPATFINIRGNPHALGTEVKPGFPEVFGIADPPMPTPAKDAKSSGRRTVLANWLAADSNPMTARVMVNRLWLHHFGQGLVASPNDFGKLGFQPTHTELLNWLAAEFMKPSDNGAAWTLKRMHKLLMTSAAYQRSSQANAENAKTDPANTWYWRFNMRRLNAEEVRDSVLAASGQLNLQVGGPSVYPKIPREVLAGQSVPGSGWHYNPGKPEEGNRRSVYVHVKRSLQVPILANNDQADPDNSCPVRFTTTVPTQALGMLNGEFTNENAVALAKRMKKESPKLDDQVAAGIRWTTGRNPMAEEIRKDQAFIQSLKAKHNLSDEAALVQYALMLLNANEFVYLD